MLVLVWLLMLMMKSGAALNHHINAQSGEAVLMTPDWQGSDHKLDFRRTSQLGPPKLDYRWTYPHLGLMSLKKNMSSCHHSRCELLKNGSLRFSRVQAEDSGNYSLEVFDEDGQLLSKSDFLLIVKGSSSSPGSTVALVVSVLLCCFILVFIFIFIKMRRSQNTSATTVQLQENIYVEMHGDGKKEKQEEEEEEEESHYVLCNTVVSLETPITLSADAEDIYV
ncbi:uncharacterized protein LOC113744387 isoform X2 [Larimichthys crocea]|uniref:uncharacterized protein LOC113744387 isoform X2 n=1 Tax=Larimichthys crocea TaxID=215358 RepID=UPI000F6005FA|nr:uncharacterized protein LOC113744387 isoform X2 [Larimichthys crocea]